MVGALAGIPGAMSTPIELGRPVSGDVDEGNLSHLRPGSPAVAQLDGQSPPLFFGQPIGVGGVVQLEEPLAGRVALVDLRWVVG